MYYKLIWIILYISYKTNSVTWDNQNINYFLTNKNVDYLQYNISDPPQWFNAVIPNCTTIFLIHGWDPWGIAHAKKLFAKTTYNYLKVPSSEGCYNIVYIAWSASSHLNYYEAARAGVTEVSENIAKMITEMYQRHVLPGRLDCTGHSLGAHICGNIGRKLISVKPFLVVTGLDPAGPSFTTLLVTQDLSKYKLQVGDGGLVSTLMTNGGTAGTTEHLGDVNFIANQGRSQPNCSKVIPICSHIRAIFLYETAVLDPKFVGESDEGISAIFGRCMNLDTAPGVYEFTTRGGPYYGSQLLIV